MKTFAFLRFCIHVRLIGLRPSFDHSCGRVQVKAILHKRQGSTTQGLTCPLSSPHNTPIKVVNLPNCPIFCYLCSHKLG